MRRNHVSATLALLPFALVIAVTTLTWTSPARTFSWLFLVLAVLLFNSIVARRFLAESTPSTNLKPWIKRLLIGEIAFVSVWALLPTMVGAPESDVLRVFLLVAVLVIGAVSTVLSHTLPSAVYASALPLAAVIIQLVVDRHPTERWMIAGLCFTALLLFVGLANRLYSSTLENMQARAEKDELFTEVEQANLRLREAMRRAEEASAAKSRFLATMSHELRTPLNAILGFSEVIKDELFGPIGNEQYKSYVQDIHRSGEHLLQLINEVLDLSRIEAASMSWWKRRLTSSAWFRPAAGCWNCGRPAAGCCSAPPLPMICQGSGPMNARSGRSRSTCCQMPSNSRRRAQKSSSRLAGRRMVANISR